MNTSPISLHYENAQVTVYYNNSSSYSDTGMISYMDSSWIELTKGNNDKLLIPVVAIRLVKLLEAPKSETYGDVLLRPVQTAPANSQTTNAPKIDMTQPQAKLSSPTQTQSQKQSQGQIAGQADNL